MKQNYLIYCLLALLILSSACKNEDAETYQGAEISKPLIEGIISHWRSDAVCTNDNRNRSFFINQCGDYIAIPGAGINPRYPRLGVSPMGYILLDEHGDSIAGSDALWYENIGKFSNGIAPFINLSNHPMRDDELMWGIMNTKGEYILPAEYNFIGPWMNGNCVIIKDGMYGVHNDKNQTIVPLGKYNTLACFENGIIAAVKGKLIGLLDREGKEITPFQFEGVRGYKGLIFVKKNGKWGALDKDIKEVIPFEYEYISVDCYYRNYAFLQNERNTICLDENGHQIPNPHPCLNHSIVTNNNNEYAILDSDGKVIIPFDYDYIKEDGGFYFCRVKNNDKDLYHCYNKSGEKVIESEHWSDYSFAQGYNEDGFAFGSADKCTMGLYDNSGKQLIPSKYEGFVEDDSFYEACNKDGSFDIYTKKGKKVSTIEERGEFPIKFLNGYYGIVRNFEKRLIEGTRSSFRNEFCGAKTYFLNHDGKFLFEIEGVFHVKENPGVVTNIHESYMKGIMKDYDVK